MRGGIRTHCSRGHAHGPCRGRRVSVFTPPSNRPIAIPPRGGDEWLKHDRKPGGALTARGGAENGSVPVAVGRADPTLRGRRHWAFWGGRIQFAVRAAPPSPQSWLVFTISTNWLKRWTKPPVMTRQQIEMFSSGFGSF